MAIRPEATVIPLYRARRSHPPVPIGFAGTAFFVAPEVVVTCWHCVKEPLSDECGYLAVVMQEGGYADWLDNISQDENGSDLATANLRGKPEFQFTLATDDALQGVDISAFGYPFSGLKAEHFEAPKAVIEARLFKGYVMRTFTFDYSGFGPTLSYELNFPAPRGLSGAPLIRMFTPQVLGVVYGNNDVATTEHLAEIDEDGKRRPEVQRIVSYGVAHHTNTLRSLAGIATKHRPLSQVMRSR